MALSKERLEQRLDYVCGSDAAVILGISPWANIIDLWLEKTRLKETKEQESKSLTAGVLLEDAVANWFEIATGIKNYKDDSFITNNEYGFMAANIDRRIEGENAILECKTSQFADGWGEEGVFQIPDYYLCQVAHYAVVTNVERVYVAVLIRGIDFRWYTYERNEKFEKFLISKETEFWHHVLNQEPPPATNHAEIISLYQDKCNNTPKTSITRIDEAIYELKELNKVEKELSAKQKILQDEIKAYMQDHDALVDLSGKVAITWKASAPSKRFDASLFKNQEPALYDQYTKECTGIRRFLLK